MGYPIHEYAIKWFTQHEKLVAIQLRIGNPVRWVCDGYGNDPGHIQAFIEMASPALTADDTLDVLHAIYPDPSNSWRIAVLAGRPLAVVDHDLLFSMSMEQNGLEIWILRRSDKFAVAC